LRFTTCQCQVGKADWGSRAVYKKAPVITEIYGETPPGKRDGGGNSRQNLCGAKGDVAGDGNRVWIRQSVSQNYRILQVGKCGD
jgi:hypothetical protein